VGGGASSVSRSSPVCVCVCVCVGGGVTGWGACTRASELCCCVFVSCIFCARAQKVIIRWKTSTGKSGEREVLDA